MNRLRHQLFAHTRFAGDQDRQVTAAHQRDFVDQAFVGFALAYQFFVGGAVGLPVQLGLELFVFHPQRQPFNTLGHVYRSGREAGEGLQGIQLDGFEAFRVQGIQGQQPPGFLVNEQRATHAIVNFQMLGQPVHQAVVRVGEVAITGKSCRAGAAEQHIKARVFADLEASSEGVEAQAVNRQRHQPLAIKAQQGGGIARQQSAHGLKQAAVTLALWQFAGQVSDQGQ